MERSQPSVLEDDANVAGAFPMIPVEAPTLDYARFPQLAVPRKNSLLKKVVIGTVAALAVTFASCRAERAIHDYLVDRYSGVVCH